MSLLGFGIEGANGWRIGAGFVGLRCVRLAKAGLGYCRRSSSGVAKGCIGVALRGVLCTDVRADEKKVASPGPVFRKSTRKRKSYLFIADQKEDSLASLQ